MNLAPPLSASLLAIGTVLASAHDPWWIIAGAAVALHGVDAGPVADVDVLISVDDAARIFPALGLVCAPGSAHPQFRSRVFGRWHGTALPVEWMADFHCKAGAAWVPVQPTTRQRVVLERTVLHIPERAELMAMLTAFGRPKDLQRARRLAAPA